MKLWIQGSLQGGGSSAKWIILSKSSFSQAAIDMGHPNSLLLLILGVERLIFLLDAEEAKHKCGKIKSTTNPWVFNEVGLKIIIRTPKNWPSVFRLLDDIIERLMSYVHPLGQVKNLKQELSSATFYKTFHASSTQVFEKMSQIFFRSHYLFITYYPHFYPIPPPKSFEQHAVSQAGSSRVRAP